MSWKRLSVSDGADEVWSAPAGESLRTPEKRRKQLADPESCWKHPASSLNVGASPVPCDLEEGDSDWKQLGYDSPGKAGAYSDWKQASYDPPGNAGPSAPGSSSAEWKTLHVDTAPSPVSIRWIRVDLSVGFLKLVHPGIVQPTAYRRHGKDAGRIQDSLVKKSCSMECAFCQRQLSCEDVVPLC